MSMYFNTKWYYIGLVVSAIVTIFTTLQIIESNKITVQELVYSFSSNNAYTRKNHSGVINTNNTHRGYIYARTTFSNKSHGGHTSTVNSNNTYEIINYTSTINTNSTYKSNDHTMSFINTHLFNRYNYSKYILKKNHRNAYKNSKLLLLTLFTTFSSKKVNEIIQLNTLRNWALFLPNIKLIVYTDLGRSTSVVQTALKLGWKVFPIRSIKLNLHHEPFLKEMFFHAMKISKSHFYGYANNDILFNYGLFKTLDRVSARTGQFNKTSVLITGRSTNVNVMSNNTHLYNFTDITKKVNQSSERFLSSANDYILISRCKDFLWNIVKDVVVGKTGYDNNFVRLFRNHKHVTIVDATRPILAVHQGDD